jgi:hypothetical protein
MLKIESSHYAMMTYRGSGGVAPPFLISAVDVSASRPNGFTSGTDWIGHRAGLDTVEKRKPLTCWDSNPGRPACSQSLYRLSHLDSLPADVTSFDVDVKLSLKFI